MDGSAFRNLDGLDRMIWWGLFGMVCAGAIAIAGIGFAIWFVLNHVQIV